MQSQWLLLQGKIWNSCQQDSVLRALISLLLQSLEDWGGMSFARRTCFLTGKWNIDKTLKTHPCAKPRPLMYIMCGWAVPASKISEKLTRLTQKLHLCGDATSKLIFTKVCIPDGIADEINCASFGVDRLVGFLFGGVKNGAARNTALDYRASCCGYCGLVA